MMPSKKRELTNVPVIMKMGGHQHGRKRKVDRQHALDIVEFGGRGYHVWVHDPLTWWSVQCTIWKSKDGLPLFVNQREGTIHSFKFRPYKGSEDGRLYDELPDWLEILRTHLTAVMPDDVWWSGGIGDDEA